MIQQARKWEEVQFLGELAVHTQKLEAWRRSIQVQIKREARKLPTGKWNRRTTEKFIPASAAAERVGQQGPRGLKEEEKNVLNFNPSGDNFNPLGTI